MDDITPAKPAEPAAPPATVPEPAAAAPSPVPAAEPAPEKPAEAPAEPSLAAKPEQVESAAPSAGDAQKKRGPMPAVITVVILVVLGLGAAAYFAFLKEDPKPADSASQSGLTTQTPAKEETAGDVSGTIDESLSDIDESKDYDTTGLSDTSLNL